MKRNLIGWSLGLLLAAVLVVPTIGLAGGGAGPGGRGPGGPGGRGGPDGPPLELLESLDLEPAARTRIRAILDESRGQGEKVNADKRKARRELRELLDQDAPDEALVMQRVEALGRLETEARKLRIRTMLRIRQVLTPEQRGKLAALHHERGPKLGTACQVDVQTLCPEAEGRRDAFRCLVDQQDRVSAGCKEALSSRRGHGKRGGRGHPGPAIGPR